MQFFIMVHFGNNEERTLTFMVGNRMREANFSVFANTLGYKFQYAQIPFGLRIHDKEIMNRNKLRHLCEQGGRIGHATAREVVLSAFA